MNGASSLMIIVLLAALVAGMVFLVGQLNQNAEEIMADRQTIQDLQSQLELARTREGSQKQALDGLNAALAEKTSALEQANQSLQAALSESAALRQNLVSEQQLRGGFENLAASLADQVRALQQHSTDLEAQVNSLTVEKANLMKEVQNAAQPQIPVTGQPTSSAEQPASSTGLPIAASAAGLVLTGGGIALAKKLAHHAG